MIDNEKRKGIWIPIEVMKCADLDCTDKFLLSEIISLHKLNNGCHASNEFFAEMLNITRSAASKRITKLSEKGFIKTEKRYNKQRCIGRMITPTDKIHVYAAISTAQGEENGSSSENHSEQSLTLDGVSQKNHDVPERPGGSSQTTIGVVPEQPEGSSLETIGVVPERLEGSSPGNTTNTYINSNIINTNKKTDLEKQLLVQDSGENFVEVFSITNSSIDETETSKVDPAEEMINPTPAEAKYAEFYTMDRNEHRDKIDYLFFSQPGWEEEMAKCQDIYSYLKKYQKYYYDPEFKIRSYCKDLIVSYYERYYNHERQ